MGIAMGFSKDSYPDNKDVCFNYSPPVVKGNPNPANYNLISSDTIGRFLIVKIKYLDCENYEGFKILVYRDVKLNDLLNQKLIDPHFSNNEKYYSPIARFEPTEYGKFCAKEFCHTMARFS